ncbi:hypothetical protein K431DRAFT_171219 [Polychaeton citri CBS 116435]|uniref:Uncharacterized protein n=1 Tax=Polychaeton citri CBS 116435 TaxID=1314669 RepID=A0A9P4UJV4_9PEZI|nr:hypothetical protein K431DRAFT_171219 [Polychaeton citri CBS 116435]
MTSCNGKSFTNVEHVPHNSGDTAHTYNGLGVCRPTGRIEDHPAVYYTCVGYSMDGSVLPPTPYGVLWTLTFGHHLMLLYPCPAKFPPVVCIYYGFYATSVDNGMHYRLRYKPFLQHWLALSDNISVGVGISSKSPAWSAHHDPVQVSCLWAPLTHEDQESCHDDNCRSTPFQLLPRSRTSTFP